MRKIINKTICVLLVLVMNISITAVHAGDIQNNSHHSDILVQMGIIDADFAVSESIVTRGEFSEVLCDVLTWNNLAEIVSADRQVFTDVLQWDWIAGDLEFLANRGIISGYDDGSFRTDAPLELCSAYSMMLNVLGYRDFVKVRGDYPEAVMEVANITELNDGFAAYKYNKELTRKMAAELLDNMIRTKTMVLDGIAKNGGLNFSTSKTFLNEYMQIYEYKGIITGAEGKSILGNSLPSDKVEIDGISYENMAGDLLEMIGCSTTYYLEQNNGVGDTLWAVIPDKKNNILELDSDLIDTYENSEVIYNDNGKTKTAKVSLEADILKNTEVISRYYTYVPEYGSIRLIDNNNDKKYDVVIISDYETIIVNNVDTEREIIYGKNIDGNGDIYKLDITEFEYSGIFDTSGNTVDMNELAENGILTGEITEGKYLRLIYSEQNLTGTVTCLNYDDSDRLSVTIGDLVYKVIYNVYSPKGKLYTGMTCKVLLDHKGNIAAVINSTDGWWCYGYLMFAGNNETNDGIIFKILTQGGKIEILESSNNFKLDSVKVDKGTAINFLRTRQLVRYRMKGEQIAAIDTAIDQNADDLSKSNTDRYNSLLRRGDTTVTYRPALSIFKRPSEAPPLPVLDCEIPIATDTIIFSIPADSDTADESDYKVIQKSALTDGEECRVESFNTLGDEVRVEAVVMHSNETQIKLEARPFIVEKVYQTLNSDDDITYTLRGYASGVKVERTLKSADLLTKTKSSATHTIEPGDVLRTRQNNKGYTTNIEILYTVSDDFGELNKKSLFGSNGTTHGSILRCAYGKITYKDDTTFALLRKKDAFSKITEVHSIKGFAIYVCDTTKKKTDVYIGTVGDIPNVIAGTESPEDIIVCTSQASPRDLIIIKK